MSTPEPNGDRKVPAVLSAMKILDYIASVGCARGNQVRVALGLNPSTCHDTLQTLLSGGYLSRDNSTKEYFLGPILTAVGVKAFSEEFVIRVGRPVLRQWVVQTSFSAFLARALPDMSTVVIDSIEGTQQFKLVVGVGQRFPPTAGGLGKIYYAFADPAVRLPVELPRFAENTISDLDEWKRDLELVRTRGWAESRGEYYGSGNAVAAPILGPNGEVVAVLGSIAPGQEMKDEDLHDYGSVIRDAARSIAEGLKPRL
ncbi:IclR family transcriptional regulator [Jatrophihabitans sp. DSM 45814]